LFFWSVRKSKKKNISRKKNRKIKKNHDGVIASSLSSERGQRRAVPAARPAEVHGRARGNAGRGSGRGGRAGVREQGDDRGREIFKFVDGIRAAPIRAAAGEEPFLFSLSLSSFL